MDFHCISTAQNYTYMLFRVNSQLVAAVSDHYGTNLIGPYGAMAGPDLPVRQSYPTAVMAIYRIQRSRTSFTQI